MEARLFSNLDHQAVHHNASNVFIPLSKGHFTFFISLFLFQGLQVNIPSFQRIVTVQRFCGNLFQHQASLLVHLCNQTSRDHISGSAGIENTGNLSERQQICPLKETTYLPTQSKNRPGEHRHRMWESSFAATPSSFTWAA